MNASSGREGYLIEFQRIGQTVKVSAIDPASGIEVAIVGPSGAGEEALKRVAVRKLEYVLRRRGAGDRRSARR